MLQHDPQWFDHMYNNRVRVADSAQILQRRAAASALVRRSESCNLDVRYGSGRNETLDLFPCASSGAPVLVFIHGGYWRGLDKSDHSFIAPAFTRERVCVVLPNYALCPGEPGQEVSVPHIVMQTVQALAWTWRNAARYGGDRRRITVVGHSAGGHLAAMLLACVWSAYSRDLPERLVRNAMSISGVHDLEPIRQTPFLQVDLRLTPEQAHKASPALLPCPRAGLLNAVVGADESEEFLRQNQLMQDAWGRARVPVSETLPGLNHFSVLDALVEPGHRLHALVQQLLA